MKMDPTRYGEPPVPLNAVTIALRDYQQAAVDDVRAAFAAKQWPVLFVLPTGGGKCLAAGTPVLMFDGTTRRVEDVRAGDDVMGPDGAPRRVVSTCAGREELYRVTPRKGAAYVVNESHILSLKITGVVGRVRAGDGRYYRAGEVANLTVTEYLRSSSSFRHVAKGWRVAVDFPARREPLPVEPYFLGLWLGDGHSHIASITTSDEEVVQYLIDYSKRLGMRLGWKDNSALSIVVGMHGEVATGRGGTVIMNALRSIGVVRNKHIPHSFKTASRRERLELLAGLIDTDGHYNGKGYDLTLKSETLIDDAIFVARSLGFAAYKSPCRKVCTNNGATGSYWRCNISGDIDAIPVRIGRKVAAPRRQKKDVLVTGITVEPVGLGDYFGFELAGPDRLFLLGDFTVTHNTYTFSYIAHSAATLGRRVCIIVHRKELLLQASASLRNLGIQHGLISPQFTPQPHHQVQVASVDTLIQRLKKGPMRFDLVIYDEAHHVIDGNKWSRVYEQLGKPPMLGVTATPVRTDGKGLGRQHGGLFATMVLGPSVRDLIVRGMLVEPEVFSSPTKVDLSGIRKTADGDYNQQALADRVDKPVITGDAVRHYQDICPGRRAIVFCSSIQHATHVRDAFNSAGYRFALLVGQPTMSDAERTAVNKALRAGELDGACTVDLVSEGYDLPDLEVCIMLRPTQSEALFLQQVGRVMRPAAGKTTCWLLDHVGNVGAWKDGEFKRKHGLPGEARDWTLEGRKKKARKAEEDEVEADPMKQCPSCYRVHEPAPECPHCGHVYETKARGGLEQVDGRLQKITPEMAQQIAAAKKQRVKSAKTLEELLRVEQELGYKPGWAKATYDARARVRERYRRPAPPIEAYEQDIFRR